MTQDEAWNGSKDRSGKDSEVRCAWHRKRLETIRNTQMLTQLKYIGLLLDVNANVGENHQPEVIILELNNYFIHFSQLRSVFGESH